MTTTAQATVRGIGFRGARSGSFPLTWGQRWVWSEFQWFGPQNAHLNVYTEAAVEAGTDIDDVLSALRALVERNESLRTRFTVAADGSPRQLVAARGSIDVHVREAPHDTVDQWCDQVRRQLADAPFQEEGWPFRAAVVTSDGQPRRVVLVLSHLAADAWAAALLCEELSRALRGALPPPSRIGIQPADQAAFEQSEQGRATTARSLAYWSQQTRGITAACSPGADAVFREMYLESPALGTAARALAARYGITAPTLILAIWVALLGVRSPDWTCASMLYSNNRLGSRRSAAAGTFVQDVPIRVPVRRLTFENLLTATFNAAVSAYRFGRYDPFALSDGSALPYSINVSLPARLTGEDADGAGIARQLPATTIRWSRDLPKDRIGRQLYLMAFEQGQAIGLALRADVSVHPEPDSTRLLRDFERIAVEAATTPGLTVDDIAHLVGRPHSTHRRESHD